MRHPRADWFRTESNKFPINILRANHSSVLLVRIPILSPIEPLYSVKLKNYKIRKNSYLNCDMPRNLKILLGLFNGIVLRVTASFSESFVSSDGTSYFDPIILVMLANTSSHLSTSELLGIERDIVTHNYLDKAVCGADGNCIF
jgi:hypothetical protein